MDEQRTAAAQPEAAHTGEPVATIKHQIKHRNGAVLYEAEVPADTPAGMIVRVALEKAIDSGAYLGGADLSGADLSGADLGEQKNDFWEILLRAPGEIAGLRAALVEGRVDGSTYQGACACLVGTIANVRGVGYIELGNGIKPNSDRPAERWFMGIHEGDTPETSQISAITVQWLDEFVALLTAAKA